MTRLIKQIGQNIIGSVGRPPTPSRKHYTPSVCAHPPLIFRLERWTDLMSVCASINPSHIYYCCRTTNVAIGLVILIPPPPPLLPPIRDRAASSPFRQPRPCPQYFLAATPKWVGREGSKGLVLPQTVFKSSIRKTNSELNIHFVPLYGPPPPLLDAPLDRIINVTK